MQSAVFSLVYTSTWPAPFLVYTSTWPAQSLVYTSTWPAQLWGGIQLSSPWYTHSLASSVLSIHIPWPAQFLVYTLPGQLSSWYTHSLASSVLGIHVTWPAQLWEGLQLSSQAACSPGSVGHAHCLSCPSVGRTFCSAGCRWVFLAT